LALPNGLCVFCSSQQFIEGLEIPFHPNHSQGHPAIEEPISINSAKRGRKFSFGRSHGTNLQAATTLFDFD
jgi:hypothetical protein